MIRILSLISAHLILSSSLALDYGEGYGFEDVSDIGDWLQKNKYISKRLLLRGSNHTALDVLDASFYEVIDDNYSEVEDVEDWEEAVEYNATTFKDEDESHGRHLAMMTNRDMQWLNSHNARRRKYHAKFNKKYMPLRWSRKLKRLSKKWAKHLASQCGSQGIYHDPNNRYGENLASNWGTGSYAKRPSTNSVLTRLVEDEEKLGYPKNGHYTQVLWRATALVGCAEHTKIFSDGSGKKCHIQVRSLAVFVEFHSSICSPPHHCV